MKKMLLHGGRDLLTSDAVDKWDFLTLEHHEPYHFKNYESKPFSDPFVSESFKITRAKTKKSKRKMEKLSRRKNR